MSSSASPAARQILARSGGATFSKETTSDLSGIVGIPGQISVGADGKKVAIGDGTTPGGIPVFRADGDGSNIQIGRTSAPAVLKPASYFAEQIVDLSNFWFDATRYFSPLPPAAPSTYTPANLLTYSQSDGIDAMFAAVKLKMQAMQAQLTINQYFRGSVRVILPRGVIPFTRTHTYTGARVMWAGQGSDDTVFVKCGGDFGDGLVFNDPRDTSQTGGVFCYGGGGHKGYSILDTTATTSGRLLFLKRQENQNLVDIRVHNGYRGIAMQGCSNIMAHMLRAKSDVNFSTGAFRSGSAFLALEDLAGYTSNQDIQIYGGVFAGDSPGARYVEDAILIENADVFRLFGGELACVARADVHCRGSGSASVQDVALIHPRLDDNARFGFLISGGTSGIFDAFDVKARAKGHEQNHARIEMVGAKNITLDIAGQDSGYEAVLSRANGTRVRGHYRGVGYKLTSHKQASAIWLSGDESDADGVRVRQAGPFDVAYGVEFANPNTLCSAAISRLFLGTQSVAGIRNPGGVDTTGATAAAAPATVSTAGAATVPKGITATL